MLWRRKDLPILGKGSNRITDAIKKLWDKLNP